MKRFFKIFLWTMLAGGVLVAGGTLLLFGQIYLPSNRMNYRTIEDIPAPSGYERVDGCSGSFAAYLRALPLKPRGGKTELYKGGTAPLQFLTYAVVDLPLISNDEQCADMCMRLRAEYLYQTGQAGKIHFMSVNGEQLRFGGGGREALTSYLRKVYGVANTYSLRREMKERPLADVQPGDVLVFDSSRHGGPYGHAIMVADVAINPKTGKIALLLAEGSTPACNLHVIENWHNLWRSPWFVYEPDAEQIPIFVFSFRKDDLRKW